MTTAEMEVCLAEAEKAYHQLQIGGGVRTLVDQSGERIEYSPASLPKLAAYIQDLKRQLGLLCGSGPMRFWN